MKKEQDELIMISHTKIAKMKKENAHEVAMLMGLEVQKALETLPELEQMEYYINHESIGRLALSFINNLKVDNSIEIKLEIEKYLDSVYYRALKKDPQFLEKV